MSRHDFETELIKLINRESMERGSDTPDYILAAYLMRCLDAWNITMADRDHWYRKPVPEPSHLPKCMRCLDSGQVTPLQDGSFSPGPSSASIDCPSCRPSGATVCHCPWCEGVRTWGAQHGTKP